MTLLPDRHIMCCTHGLLSPCYLQTEETWLKNKFWADKKDHCVVRYKKALCAQIKKQLDSQEQVCKMFPCKTDACSLRVSAPANSNILWRSVAGLMACEDVGIRCIAL